MSETDEKKYKHHKHRHKSADADPLSVNNAERITLESAAGEAPVKEAAAPEGSGAGEQDVNPVALDTKFEYIVPKETFEQHVRRRHRSSSHSHGSSSHSHGSSSHSHSSGSGTKRMEGDSNEDFIFMKPRKKRRRRRHRSKWKRMAPWARALIIIAAVILILAILLASVFFVLREIGRRGVHQYEEVNIETPVEDESGNEVVNLDDKGKVITYDGKSYELNEDIISVAFIGLDEGKGTDAGLNMADAIYVLTVDAKTGEIVILGVSRDTMADVDVYATDGTFVDTERLQMAYTYAYGSRSGVGAANTTQALSRLFFGLPFSNYFAMGMNEMISLNDYIGGVTLESLMTFNSPVDGRTIYEGDTVTLHGKEADYYLRARDTGRLESNNDRMQRQQQYIRAFLNSVIPAIKSDFNTLLVLNDVISVNADTNIDISKLTYMGSVALEHMGSAADIRYVSLQGEITAGEHAEMNVTNEELIKTMIDIFYKPYDGDVK